MSAQSASESHKWIVKSNVGSLGSQVHMFVGNSPESLSELLSAKYDARQWLELSAALATPLMVDTAVLQHYIDRPLLVDGRFKFDLRCYVLIASTHPTIALWHRGKMRICGVEFGAVDDWMSEEARYAHLSNCRVQRSHDDYKHESHSVGVAPMLGTWDELVELMLAFAKEGRFADCWFDEFARDGLTATEMAALISRKCRRVAARMLDSVAARLDADCAESGRHCQFAFHGWDILVDESGGFWLIEANRCAAISLNGTDDINELTRNMLAEMVDIEMELRARKVAGEEMTQDTCVECATEWERIELGYHREGKEKGDCGPVAHPDSVCVDC